MPQQLYMRANAAAAITPALTEARPLRVLPRLNAEPCGGPPRVSAPPQPHENRPLDDDSFLVELPAPLRSSAVESIIGSLPLRACLSGAPHNSESRAHHLAQAGRRLRPSRLRTLHAV